MLTSRAHQITDVILRYYSNPLVKYKDGSYVLQRIIEERGFVELLLEYPGLDTESRGIGDRTPLISACFPQVSQNIKQSYNTDYIATTNPETAQILPDKGACVNAIDVLGRNALHWICTLSEDIDDAHKSIFASLKRAADIAGLTPLLIATQRVQTWAITTLILLDASSLVTDVNGNNAL